MKRKTLEDLFDDLHIDKKIKINKDNNKKLYTQNEVNQLLKDQENFLFSEFKKYIDDMRKRSEFNIPNWTSV